MKYFLLILIVLGLLAGCTTTPSSPGQLDVNNLPDNLTVAQTKELLNRTDVVILDVREPSEYAQGHIPGVRLIPTKEVPQRMDEIPRDKPVIVTCRTGSRSGAVVRFLREQGYTDVHNMDGGIVAWQGAGYPVEP